jgi:hypothetical protein
MGGPIAVNPVVAFYDIPGRKGEIQLSFLSLISPETIFSFTVIIL